MYTQELQKYFSGSLSGVTLIQVPWNHESQLSQPIQYSGSSVSSQYAAPQIPQEYKVSADLEPLLSLLVSAALAALFQLESTVLRWSNHITTSTGSSVCFAIFSSCSSAGSRPSKELQSIFEEVVSLEQDLTSKTPQALGKWPAQNPVHYSHRVRNWQWWRINSGSTWIPHHGKSFTSNLTEMVRTALIKTTYKQVQILWWQPRDFMSLSDIPDFIEIFI